MANTYQNFEGAEESAEDADAGERGICAVLEQWLHHLVPLELWVSARDGQRPLASQLCAGQRLHQSLHLHVHRPVPGV